MPVVASLLFALLPAFGGAPQPDPVTTLPPVVVEVAPVSPVLSSILEAAIGDQDPTEVRPEHPIVVTELGASNCPVAGDHDFISSWGFARDGGRRKHQGNDIFAARGTPVVAITSGEVIKVDRVDSPGELGGRTVWTRNDDGVRFYYAHLEEVNPDLKVGQHVTVGDQLGTVGTSGNARGTDPHLHFEIRPPGGPIDPYPLLSKICEGAR